MLLTVAPTLASDSARLARAFHALSDPIRLRVVGHLLHGERCVCDLASALEVGQSRLSFHLKTLKDAGIIRDRRAGRWNYYSLDPGVLSDLEASVQGFARAAERISPLTQCCG